MLIDQTTLEDLEVFSAPDGTGGLFSLLDRTVTDGGRAALRRRLSNPPSDIEVVRRTQDAVRFLQRHPRAFGIAPPFVAAVSNYLQSNIATGRTSDFGSRAEYAWMCVRYRGLIRELREGVGSTFALFRSVTRLCEEIQALDPPDLIQQAVVTLGETSEFVLRADHGAGGLLEADRTLRVGHRDRILEALALLSEMDALNAMAAATHSLGWVMPELVESDTFELDAVGVVHPFVEHAVANPINLSGGEPTVFLTGPNMAGKTTYLRSVALSVLLGQAGMGVPAQRMRFTPVEALLTSLNPSDNLRAGLSYFLAEVMRVKAAASILAEGRRALMLFDEVFKGTNVRDALDASAEVILGFSKARRSGFIFSSHLVELVEVLEASASIRFRYFDGDFVEGSPRYTYQLREGVSTKRFGLLLLRQAEVPDLIARISA